MASAIIANAFLKPLAMTTMTTPGSRTRRSIEPAPAESGGRARRRSSALENTPQGGDARAAGPRRDARRVAAQRFAELAREDELPERLVEAIVEARSITAWGGRKRALQYVGKLLRDIDPQPILRRLDAWAHGHDVDTARERALEHWRERLIAEPAALDALTVEYPGLDRSRFRALIGRAREERERGTPPHAFREIYRELKGLLRATPT
jgi:ribosome-associated protein